MSQGVPGRLVGEASEAEVMINGVVCQALLDTGSTVSSITQSFYDAHLVDFPLHPINDLLKVECASGQLLPYVGYVEAELRATGITETSGQPALFLVVPDTRYSNDVPVLLGTNLLQPLVDGCREEQGPRFVQKIAHLTPWWLAFRCLSLKKRETARAAGRVGIVKCNSAGTLTIAGNRRMVVTGSVSDAVASGESLVVIHSTPKTVLPDGVEIMPHLIKYAGNGDVTVQVEIANPTSSPVIIQPRAVLCELQPVDVNATATDGDQPASSANDGHDGLEDNSQAIPRKDIPNAENEVLTDDAYLEQFSLPKDIMTKDEIGQMKSLLLEYRDIFSEGDFDIGKTTLVKHHINLSDDTPFKQRHRRIPPAMKRSADT